MDILTPRGAIKSFAVVAVVEMTATTGLMLMTEPVVVLAEEEEEEEREEKDKEEKEEKEKD